MAYRPLKQRLLCLGLCLLLTAAFLEGCGSSAKDKAEKVEKTKKEDPAEKAREEAVAKTKERPEVIDEDDGDLLILVNKQYGLSKNYVPGDLVQVKTCDTTFSSNTVKKMKSEAAEALEELFTAAREEDHEIVLRTGYRPYGYQEALYNSYVKSKGKDKADTYSARPGYSEHQTGLCCDVGIKGVDLNSFTNTRAAKWLEKNAWHYGYIVRYPQKKEDITGYIYESWHIRYVGKEPAAYMHKHEMTLEEYLDQVPEETDVIREDTDE